MLTTDYLIIGAGIIGLTVAREFQRQDPGARVMCIDKESSIGKHASGRNSGVLHSGIYYPSDSLKARFTREGNLAWQAYCDEKALPIDRCGKLIVARNQTEHNQLAILQARARDNEVSVKRMDTLQIQELEPRALTYKDALFVPSTATVDPMQLLGAQQADFVQAGGKLLLNHPYHGREENRIIRSGQERIKAGKVINCAGLYADKVAHDFGFGLRYTLLPFKGLYHYAKLDMIAPRCHIYPVPDLRNPFLGVHLTRTMNGGTKIGPTAIPAFWREHYGGLSGWRFNEFFEVISRELQMLVTNRNNFRSLAWQEIRKYRSQTMINEAAMLMAGVAITEFDRTGRPGIRAQLVERSNNQLVMDFVIEGDEYSTHVLNAISPAWTCAMPLSEYVVAQCLQMK